MSGLSLTLLGIALFMTLGVLFVGLFAMARGGDFNKKYGNRLMRFRIIFQGIALLLFAVAMLTKD
ncbi:MAG: twin transmembrane helix small protein [Kiloniellales bacterium]|nr:twin transmembrane helix small protein [Kiloniellales bacterium]